MAIPRKGSRRIHVAGHDYRWAVAPDDEPGVGIVVERWDISRHHVASQTERQYYVRQPRNIDE